MVGEHPGTIKQMLPGGATNFYFKRNTFFPILGFFAHNLSQNWYFHTQIAHCMLLAGPKSLIQTCLCLCKQYDDFGRDKHYISSLI